MNKELLNDLVELKNAIEYSEDLVKKSGELRRESRLYASTVDIFSLYDKDYKGEPGQVPQLILPDFPTTQLIYEREITLELPVPIEENKKIKEFQSEIDYKKNYIIESNKTINEIIESANKIKKSKIPWFPNRWIWIAVSVAIVSIGFTALIVSQNPIFFVIYISICLFLLVVVLFIVRIKNVLLRNRQYNQKYNQKLEETVDWKDRIKKCEEEIKELKIKINELEKTIQEYEARKKEIDIKNEEIRKRNETLKIEHQKEIDEWNATCDKLREEYLQKYGSELEKRQKDIIQKKEDAALELLNKYNDEFVATKNRIKKIMNKPSVGYPEEYLSIIDEIIKYVSTSRAESIKEAINLYEQNRLYYEQNRLYRYAVYYYDDDYNKKRCFIMAKSAADACAQVARAINAVKIEYD